MTRSLHLFLVLIPASILGCSAPGGNDAGSGGSTASGEGGASPTSAGAGAHPTATSSASSASSATGSGGATTGTGSSGAGGNPLCQGQAIQAPVDQWSFAPFPATHCGYGSSTGIGINPSSKGKRLVIYLMGGGACFDATTCAPGCDFNTSFCAANLAGYDENNLAQDLGGLSPGSMFDRNDPSNPFRDDSFVIVPYCTGDFHSGSVQSNYGVHHTGYQNMQEFLKQIVPTFCDAPSVVLAGSSAGGFGAVFTYELVKTSFGSTHVDLIDDSGPPLSPQYMPDQSTMRAAWGSAANAPAGCADCKTSWAAFYPYYAAHYPDARMSLISSLADPSIGPHFGGPIAAPQGYRDAMNTFADTVINPLSNARVYYVDEFHHVYLADSLAGKVSQGVSLASFLSAQESGAPSWQSVRP